MQKKYKPSPFTNISELFTAETRDLNDVFFDPSASQIEVITKFNGNIKRVAEELGGTAEIIYENYAILTLDKTKIVNLVGYSEIEHLELPKNLYFEGAINLNSSCITAVQRSNGYNLSGKGVVVAIIDSGIDYTHLDFRNSDGTSRVQFIWDQTQIGTPPVGFNAGAEYNNQQINSALQSEDPFLIVPSRDYNGHGTAVTGIATGNGASSAGINTGVAPQADIIAVKVGYRGYESFARSTELMRAIKYVIEKAKRMGKPICINLSFGMNNGSHKGDSLFETFITEISAEWKTSIIVPTGNEGSAGHHYTGLLETNQVQEIDFFISPGLNSLYLSLWKNFVDT
ncbi:MAG: S8 family serine peptidase, partial [Anaerotignum sp.]